MAEASHLGGGLCKYTRSPAVMCRLTIGFSKKEKTMPATTKTDGRKIQWSMERRMRHSNAMKKVWEKRKAAQETGFVASIKRFFKGL